MDVGLVLGLDVGAVGALVGLDVGPLLGLCVGLVLGLVVGLVLGLVVGLRVNVGLLVGLMVGLVLGLVVGSVVGLMLGLLVGLVVGILTVNWYDGLSEGTRSVQAFCRVVVSSQTAEEPSILFCQHTDFHWGWSRNRPTVPVSSLQMLLAMHVQCWFFSRKLAHP